MVSYYSAHWDSYCQVMGLPSKMSSLIAAGTSICGVTAITALSPAIKANERDTGVAVANVVAFGTLGMLTYPYLAHAVMDTSEQVGLFLGLAIHDTSQVMGSALTYKMMYGDEVALKQQFDFQLAFSQERRLEIHDQLVRFVFSGRGGPA